MALPEPDSEPVIGRQKVATTGKDLPEDAPAKSDEDGDSKDGAAPFAWFATAPVIDSTPIVVAAPVVRPALLPKGDARIEVPGLRMSDAALRPEFDPPAPAASRIAPAVAPALPEIAIPSVLEVSQPVPAPAVAPTVTVPLATLALATPVLTAAPLMTPSLVRPQVTTAPLASAPLATPMLAAAAPVPVAPIVEPSALPVSAGVSALPPQPPASQPGAPAADLAAAPLATPRAIPADPQIRQIVSGGAAPAATATSPISRIDPTASSPVLDVQVVPMPGVQPAASLQPAIAPLVLQPLAVALGETPATRRSTPRDPVSAAAPAAFGEAARPTLVAAPAETQHAPLDLRRHEWMGAMLDRIEAMRDSAGARETNIRLAPDALGSLDVSIRQEGDRIHVHFAADTAAARAALSEAQPRLAELAEARGLRLGQTSVGTGGDAGVAGQGGQRQQAAPSSPLASAPASARTETESTDDDRIA